jgi:hypothetical protein
MTGLDNRTVDVVAETPHGDVPIGQFHVRSGEVQGRDHRGIDYRGHLSESGSGIHVDLTLSIAAGTRIAEGQVTDADAEHTFAFDLDAEQASGRKPKAIRLPGFGEAHVRFDAD